MHSHSFKTCMILLFSWVVIFKAFILRSNSFHALSIPPYPINSQRFFVVFFYTPVTYMMIQNKKAA